MKSNEMLNNSLKYLLSNYIVIVATTQNRDTRLAQNTNFKYNYYLGQVFFFEFWQTFAKVYLRNIILRFGHLNGDIKNWCNAALNMYANEQQKKRFNMNANKYRPYRVIHQTSIPQ